MAAGNSHYGEPIGASPAWDDAERPTMPGSAANLTHTMPRRVAYALVAVLLLVLVVTGALWWFGIEPLMRARSAMDRRLLSYGHAEKLEQRVQVLTETRAETLDHAAAELRRVERDLHDGAQARLVALSMTLGMADSLLASASRWAGEMVPTPNWRTTARPARLARAHASAISVPEASEIARVAATASPAPVTS